MKFQVKPASRITDIFFSLHKGIAAPNVSSSQLKSSLFDVHRIESRPIPAENPNYFIICRHVFMSKTGNPNLVMSLIYEEIK